MRVRLSGTRHAMRLTTKGLLLIAIPAVFELSLLSAIVKAEADAAAAERWGQRGQAVLAQASRVLEPVLVESVKLRGAVAANDTGYSTPVSMWMDVDRRIDRLVDLVSDNPAQIERAVQIRHAVQNYRQWSDRVQDLLRSGRRADLAERFRALMAADVLDRVRAQIVSFQTEERRLDVLRVSAAEAARAQQQTLVMTAVLGSIALVALAVWVFTRGVRGRLDALSDNANRLAANEPLAPLTAGNDEIAELDLTLHQISQRLIEAERMRLGFQADLARRADQLARINENLRQQTQENEMFIHGVSHDLRAPLVNLQGFSRELNHACDDLRERIANSSLSPQVRERIERTINEDIGEALRYLQTAVLRASHIIDALLRLARVGRVEYRRQRVSVQELVQRVVDAMHASIRARGAQVSVQTLSDVWGDPTALEQVFANLIGNALNYLDPARDGRVEIGTAHAPPGVESLQIFYVRDNGLGIPEVGLPRLFQAFQRMHGNVASGEGIGLALVRRVVERHGGRVWVESAEGEGTTFYLSLPDALAVAPPLPGDAEQIISALERAERSEASPSGLAG
ncbi:signal transduction histidine kinase [Paraburkholderia silvatlantica]|uniref:histidine kinase n=2 Tax=Paraburkholderia silvatlantica TaxID=321895 RepID=A0ABR6FLD5_9BURK|nr:signal transduction histidine kinase [Paraburkholderia silvatlantica]PVY34704.1 CHASE3 domain-containing protein [Paraburkholderia silvatlantica]PXW38919.1 CHASE3 domain-containing protein [Paraburkholderia silvatlantica]